MDDDHEAEDQPLEEGFAGESEEKPVEDSEILSAEMVGQHISLLARTGNGLSHAYTRLEIHSKNITNIDVLENYLHLRYIDLAENAISDISALASLEYLLSVDFHSNKIKRIPASLDKRKYLQQANFAKNQIESIDVVDWPMMAWMNLNENKLTEINLPEFEELLHLEARGNKISTTKGLNARKLEKLYLANNQLTSIDLDDKTFLQHLHLRDNKISSLDGLNEMHKSLTYLNLRNNLVETLDDIWKLSNLPQLKILNLTDNPVQKVANYRIEVIYRCKHLEKLDKESVTEEEREEAELLKPKPVTAPEGESAPGIA
ncbi:UNVERIFIED_CONTAM: Leucine-rich repeat-containing protein 23 [Siphonaria sp. JEL0065]|nr:Leucine-rich repeat-containing protein 23 [Siphonaria sp. JEL0065]